ncbi:ABC transporter permease [Mesorhizobium sp.]|uniref:ABC transporter permease n=1 Tax=Mesorhizobium sp. TaxID=1871066 RepID=UPI000FE6A5BF|nr:ABC transporter permease [Mesorhizobium sp.]RWJ01245.1 MAG: ABC transporter permease [Mesorhizobium sp.]TIP95578.1 MAG: ABC transporter permease [Mesorhizobium sp.]
MAAGLSATQTGPGDSTVGAAPVRRGNFPAAGILLLGLVVPLGLLTAWTVAALLGHLPEQILPPPWIVLDTLLDGIQDGSLLSSTMTSLERVAEGFAAGAAVGLVFGTAVGLSKTLREFVDPLFLALSQVPTLGWMPIVILIVGIDEGLKIIVIGWSAFIPVVLNTSQGVRDVPEAYVELGRVLSFSRWSKLTMIVLPSAVPSIFTGLREGLANGWQTLVAVELIASFEGLGYLMAYGRQLFQLELVLSAMIVVGLIGLVIHGLLTLVENRLQRWRPETSR